MSTSTASLAWLALALVLGGAGGLLNAAVSDNLRLLPSFVKSSKGARHLLRIGLAGNVGVAAIANAVCLWALRVPALYLQEAQVGDLLTVLLASVCIGLCAARLATNEADKRLLHEAVCKASAAPAAPPDRVREMETAAPWVVYTATSEMMPPPLAAWRLGL